VNANSKKNAVSETVKTLGRLDILVNNAGIATMAPIEKFSLEHRRWLWCLMSAEANPQNH